MDGGTLAAAGMTALEKLQSSKKSINAPGAIRTTLFLRNGYTNFISNFLVKKFTAIM